VTSPNSYEGRRVVVSGGGGAGMGAAVVRQLEPLGAEIHVIDLKEPPVKVASYHATDLRDPDAIDAAVSAIGGRIDALFNCAGLPGGRFSDLDTMLVNFVGQRLLADLVVERMDAGGAIANISSGAGPVGRATWRSGSHLWKPRALPPAGSGWRTTPTRSPAATRRPKR